MMEISVVAPMHNEEACLREYYSRMKRVLDDLGVPCEMVMVNDGSTDATGDIIRELSEKDERVVGVFLARNRGQCTAIYAGLQHSTGKYVVIMDADLQHKPEDIPALYAAIKQGYDLVSGSRHGRRESFLLRRLPSRMANYMLRAVSGCSVRDMGGYSIMEGNIARALALRNGQHRLLPAMVHMAGGKVGEVPVEAPPRFAGASHYGLGRSVDVLFDIVMLWFQGSFKQRPLYLFGRVSLGFFILASLIMVWLLYEKIFFGVHMGTRPPFIGAVLFYLASMSFMSTGFILELLSANQNSNGFFKGYVVREVCRHGKCQVRRHPAAEPDKGE